MVPFTQLPARSLAQFARLLAQDADSDGSGVAELLSRVRLEFERDDEWMATHLLHYQDMVIQESQVQEPKVQFDLPSEATEANDEQCNPNRRVYPPTPARPSVEALAKLMEVSYTDWSSSSYDDTTADSKLAEWLASFAQDQISSSFENSIILQRRNFQEEGRRKTPLAVKTQAVDPRAASPGQTPWRPYPHKSTLPNSRPSGHRRVLSDPVSPSFYQHRSPPRPASPSTVRRVRLQLSPLGTSDRQRDEDIKSLHIFPPKRDNGVQGPFVPALSFEVRQQDPNIMDNEPNLSFFPSPSSTNDSIHPSPLPLDPTSPFITKSPALEQLLSFSSTLDDVKPNMIQDLSIALSNALPDISSVHAFNHSLKHASKSPFLIRTWKKMLGELTGRFPLNLGQFEKETEQNLQQDLSIDGVTENDSIFQGSLPPSEHSVVSMDAAGKDSSDTQMQSANGGTHPFRSNHKLKTQADILLDQEYAAHLRSSIDAKQEEIRMLNDLITQRKKTIDRMEKVLKARALEALNDG